MKSNLDKAFTVNRKALGDVVKQRDLGSSALFPESSITDGLGGEDDYWLTALH